MKRGIQLRKASYKKLWKILIDKDMNKKMLAEAANVSMSSMAKLSRGDTLNIEILIKICDALDCDIGDIVELIPNVQEENKDG